MQATTCFHDGIPHPILQKTDFALHDPVTFYPTNGVFDPDSDGGNTTIRGFLRGREFSSRRCFLGLDNGDVLQAESLEALILIQTAARRQRLPRQFCQALIRGLAFIRVTQEAHATGLVDHEEVFERVTLLLAAVIFLLLFRIGRAVARTFSAILPKRGVGALSSVACVLNSAANSAAVRAGSSVLVGSGLIQYGMQHVNPCVRIRLTHPKELSLHFLNGLLLQVRQNEKQFVRECGQRAGGIA